MLKRFFTIWLVCLICGLTVNAQSDACNLQIKFFEYGKASDDESISGLEASIENLKNDKKEKIETITDEIIFQNYPNGKYKVKLEKEGFEQRRKKFEVDCRFVDEDNTFTIHIYLKRKGIFLTSPPKKEVKRSDSADNKEVKELIATIPVEIVIDIDGNVISAKTDKDSEYSRKSIMAVRRAKFAPTIIGGIPMEVSGTIVYNYQ